MKEVETPTANRISRRTRVTLGSTFGTPREEPIRNYSGWTCPRCSSVNTIIEDYSTGPEGYCMTCTREIPIPEEYLSAYNLQRSQRNVR